MNFGQRQQFNRVRKNSSSVIVDLGGHQIDGHIQDRDGKNILSVAIESNNQEVFDMIMSLPREVKAVFFNVPDNEGRFPSEIAAKSTNPHYIRCLLDDDNELVNQQNKKTGSSLMHGVLRKESLGIDTELDKEISSIIKSNNPNPFLKNNRGETPVEAVNRLYNIRSQQITLEI